MFVVKKLLHLHTSYKDYMYQSLNNNNANNNLNRAFDSKGLYIVYDLS